MANLSLLFRSIKLSLNYRNASLRLGQGHKHIDGAMELTGYYL